MTQSTQTQQYELNLRDYYRIFRKRRVTLLLVFCVTVGIFYYRLSQQVPLYQSSIKVLLSLEQPIVGQAYKVGLGDQLQTQLEIIKSRPIAERAAKLLGWVEETSTPADIDGFVQEVQGSINATRIGEASFIRITASGGDSEMVPKIATAVAAAYRAYDLEERGKAVRTVRLFVEEELEKAKERLGKSERVLRQFKEEVMQGTEWAGQLRNQIVTLELQLHDVLLRATPKHPEVERLEQRIADLKKELKKLPEEELMFSRLTKEVNDNQKLVFQLKEKYNEARIRESENTSIVTIVEKATPASVSFPSDPKMGILMGATVGLLLGAVAAFFKEGLDTSIGAIEDVEAFLGVGVLAMIPHMTAKGEKRRLFFLPHIGSREEIIRCTRARLVTQFSPRSPEAESYHTLRTALYSAVPQKEKLAIAISSTGPKEGKSLTSANLAVASAQMGKKTLLIDADFRRPMVHEIFGLERIPGLFEVLTKSVSYDQALKNVSDLLVGNMKWQETLKTPHLGYLNFMTAGHLPSNPPELLDSQEITELIRVLLGEFDLLIFDAPPVIPVTDTLILAPKLDGIILVYQSGRTARNALKRAKLQLDSAKAKLLGVVFNDVRLEFDTGSSYYYRYRKYYPEDTREKMEREE